jgi:uridylate kinase
MKDSQQKIMLKISGEQLGSENKIFDNERAGKLCQIIEALVNNGFTVACIMGGGNAVRGRDLMNAGFSDPVVADKMGLLATNLNGLYLQEILKNRGDTKIRLVSAVPVEDIIDKADWPKVNQYLSSGETVLIAGGTGKPGYSTDSGLLESAVKLGCQTVVKATKVAGVYNKDPAKYPDATRYERLTYQQALDNPEIKVMDREALKIAAQNNIQIAVCQANPEAVLAILNGDTKQGTIIS